MLEEELKPTICRKHRVVLTNGVVLHHDNARPHIAVVTIEMFWKLKFRHFPHPTYSPDLTPSDYHIFGPLINALHRYQFANDEEVKDVVLMLLHVQLKTLFADGITKLID